MFNTPIYRKKITKCFGEYQGILTLHKRGKIILLSRSLNLRKQSINIKPWISKYTTYSRQKFSGLSWMVKRYYIQDYPEIFRGNTETRAIASDFIWPSIKSSLTRLEKNRTSDVLVRGRWLFTSFLTWTRLENNSQYQHQKKIIWKLSIGWSFYVILASTSELGRHTYARTDSTTSKKLSS